MPRVLVVDDEADVCQALTNLLEEGIPGLRVAHAASVGEARMKAGAGAWNLIICDERLPDGSGVDVLIEVAHRDPSTRRVLMTAYDDYPAAARAVREGRIDDLVQKPWDPEDLLRRVSDLLFGAEPGLPRPPGVPRLGRIPPAAAP